MKKSIAKYYFEVCANFHEETQQRRKFEFPDWVGQIKNEKYLVEKTYTALESALLMLANRKCEVLNDYPAI